MGVEKIPDPCCGHLGDFLKNMQMDPSLENQVGVTQTRNRGMREGK
jgi:hypothetical protein